MTRSSMLAALVVAASVTTTSQLAQATTPCSYYYPPWYNARSANWHGFYYHTAWQTPVALVCPPNAGRQTKWAWGVTNTEVTPIYHQFGRAYPGPYAGSPYPFLPTPIWPSHTDQFGVYYVRGPW